MAKYNMLMGEAVGYSGEKPDQFKRFEKLQRRANKNELLELTKHKNGVVRCYAVWALSHDSTVDIFSIVIKHLSDDELIWTQFGCSVDQERVGDFIINLVTPGYVDLTSQKLDSLEFVKLDSILIYSANNLNARSAAMERAPMSESHYQLVKEIVKSKNDPSAVVALARYHRKDDIPLIKGSAYDDNNSFVYQAIIQFPEPDFLPFLDAHQRATLDKEYYSREWADLYEAIATYKNKEALEILKRPLSQVKSSDIRKYHIDFVFNAISDKRIPLYDSLLWYFFENEQKTTKTVYRYFVNMDPERAYSVTRRYLSSNDAMTEAQNSYDYEDNDENVGLLSLMLQQVLKQDKNSGVEIICKNLRETTDRLYPIFVEHADQLKDKSFIEPLFSKLQTETNPHIYLDIVKTLINYNSYEINHRILQTRKTNINLNRDWGGKELDKLLEENKIR